MPGIRTEAHARAAQVVLEEVLTKALEEAESLAGSADPEQRGRLFAYFNILSWAKKLSINYFPFYSA